MAPSFAPCGRTFPDHTHKSTLLISSNLLGSLSFRLAGFLTQFRFIDVAGVTAFTIDTTQLGLRSLDLPLSEVSKKLGVTPLRLLHMAWQRGIDVPAPHFAVDSISPSSSSSFSHNALVYLGTGIGCRRTSTVSRASVGNAMMLQLTSGGRSLDLRGFA